MTQSNVFSDLYRYKLPVPDATGANVKVDGGFADVRTSVRRAAQLRPDQRMITAQW